MMSLWCHQMCMNEKVNQGPLYDINVWCNRSFKTKLHPVIVRQYSHLTNFLLAFPWRPHGPGHYTQSGWQYSSSSMICHPEHCIIQFDNLRNWHHIHSLKLHLCMQYGVIFSINVCLSTCKDLPFTSFQRSHSDSHLLKAWFVNVIQKVHLLNCVDGNWEYSVSSKTTHAGG